MDKLKLAHDYALVRLTCNNPKTLDEIIHLSWYYADAMQAEADKRNKAEAEQKRKEIREMLNAPNTFIEREGQHFDDVEEWQPDWSQAPEWAVAWTMDEIGAQWWDVTPSHGCSLWLADEGVKFKCLEAPSFNYNGRLVDSLRKRQQ